MSADTNKMSVPELMALYNKEAKAKGLPAVKKFRDKKTAIAKLTELAKANTAKLTELTTAKPAAAKTPAERWRKAEAEIERARMKIMDLPFKGNPDGTLLHNIRGNTINGDMVEAMSAKEGANLKQIEAIIVKRDKEAERESKDVAGRARSLMRMLHTYNGYGIKQKGDQYHLVIK